MAIGGKTGRKPTPPQKEAPPRRPLLSRSKRRAIFVGKKRPAAHWRKARSPKKKNNKPDIKRIVDQERVIGKSRSLPQGALAQVRKLRARLYEVVRGLRGREDAWQDFRVHKLLDRIDDLLVYKGASQVVFQETACRSYREAYNTTQGRGQRVREKGSAEVSDREGQLQWEVSLWEHAFTQAGKLAGRPRKELKDPAPEARSNQTEAPSRGQRLRPGRIRCLSYTTTRLRDH